MSGKQLSIAGIGATNALIVLVRKHAEIILLKLYILHLLRNGIPPRIASGHQKILPLDQGPLFGGNAHEGMNGSCLLRTGTEELDVRIAIDWV